MYPMATATFQVICATKIPQQHCCNSFYRSQVDRMEVDLVLMKELYSKYRSLYVNNRMTEGQNKNLKNWHERREHIGITLSQIDHWMMEADIIPKTMTIFDTGTTFSKLK